MKVSEWFTANDIKVLHHYLPLDKTAKKDYRLAINTDGPLMRLYRNSANELLLIQGINAYNSLKVLSPNKKVPCFVINNNISELEWCFTFLRSCFKEKVYFMVNYEYIMYALKKTNENVKKMAEEINCSEKDIQKFIVDTRVPDHYKELAIKYRKQGLVNAICQSSILKDYHDFLYKLTFRENHKLTKVKLKLFEDYIKFGYSLDIEKSYAIEWFNKIVDKKQAWKIYWEYLNNDYSLSKHYTHFPRVIKNKKIIKIKIRAK